MSGHTVGAALDRVLETAPRPRSITVDHGTEFQGGGPWVQERLAVAGLLNGRTVAIDATTLEANAAMRSIVRRDTAESYQEFLTRLAVESGIKTPTREAVARLDRRRQKRTSNKDWENPSDPDAKITKMKDGRTHLAHKAEPAVDVDSSALVAVTRQGADVGDMTSLVETAIMAAEQLEAAHAPHDTAGELTVTQPWTGACRRCWATHGSPS
jgi:hypothetical protein